MRTPGQAQAYIEEHAFRTTNFPHSSPEYPNEEWIQSISTAKDVSQYLDLDEYSARQERDSLVTWILQGAKKLSLIAAYTGNPPPVPLLEQFFKAGLTDADLPLSKNLGLRDVDDFLGAQSLFCSQPLLLKEGSHGSVIDPETPIPITVLDKHGFDGGTLPGAVVAVEIDQQDFSFPSVPPRPGKHRFAMKIIESKGRRGPDEAKREEAFVVAMRENNVSHAHLTPCYTSFQHGESWYFIQPLADGNLEHFMKKNFFGRATPGRRLDLQWLCGQMRGLADAVRRLHNPSTTTIGWHHDIKPENILVFGSAGGGGGPRFCFTDWGTAKIVECKEGSEVCGSAKHGFLTYLPPECAANVRTGTEPDIWSLGCTFLELLVWHAQGYYVLGEKRGLNQKEKDILQLLYEGKNPNVVIESEEVALPEDLHKLSMSFRSRRMLENNSLDDKDWFYDDKKHTLLKCVTDKLCELSMLEGMEEGWQLLLEIVAEMLRREPERRSKAYQVSELLDLAEVGCSVDWDLD
ncbi:kinase-like protein [Byssothecium circinans]|uniref:Kinase-like protein n=1 Tax=Byssothecium circinans TaxID=147558 RepID=A0A6A5TEX6_9PLEO|nr:kinase-like protein [Byssothecium circinans]